MLLLFLKKSAPKTKSNKITIKKTQNKNIHTLICVDKLCLSMVLSGNVVVMPSAIPLKKMVICLLAAISCEQAPGYGLCAYLPSSILGFCLAWTWAGDVCYHNLCELIFVSVLLHLGNAVLLQLFNHFCLLQSFCPIFHRGPWVLGVTW